MWSFCCFATIHIKGDLEFNTGQQKLLPTTGLWSRSRGVGRIFNLRSRSRRKFQQLRLQADLFLTICDCLCHKRHTWQSKQLDASTRDDHCYSDRRQRTNLHTFTKGPFQISSVSWAHHATYTLWMQPFGVCIIEISICSFWLALSLLRDVGYATVNESSHGSSSIVT